MLSPEINALTEKIIGAAIEVHRQLGPGLLESTYETCLAYELEQLGLHVEQQKILPLVYKKLVLDQAYRIDLLVEQAVVVEVKYIGVVPATGDGEAVLVYLTAGGLDGFHLALTEFLN